MSEQTPGPWWVRENSNETLNVIGARNADGESSKVALVNNGNLTNAHLLAAAPDMLEALRLAEAALAAELELRNACEDVPDSGYAIPAAPALAAVCAAIAKAEGRT